MTELENFTIQLQSVTYEQIELRGILDNYINKDLNNRLKSFEMLKREHKQVMSDMQNLPMEISEALIQCKRLIEENESYIFLNSLVLRDLTPLRKNADVLRLENRKLLEEQLGLQEACEEVKKLFKEVHEKIHDPCAEQHQEQESLDESLKNLLKQKEQMDLTENVQPHFSVSEMRSDNLQSEQEQATTQDESLLQTELLQQEH
ncbi:Disks large-like 5 [Cricetulus griseus]|uniref:Disks large-like 5 n=1 Tax=Cricetulus griseus TaxID=10029 RepID=G3IN26_CRIGR|nr:Disks large-like 5 [Cricetulus griseus]